MPSPDYMDKQAELKWQMRTVLMDWIIEVHSKFRILLADRLVSFDHSTSSG